MTFGDDRIIGDDLIITATASFRDENVEDSKVVSVNNITLSGADAGNYVFNTTASTIADITPASLIIIAENQIRFFGFPNPNLSLHVAGLWLMTP